MNSKTSRTVSGHSFSSQSTVILNSIARARRYPEPFVWVPLPLLNLLKLKLISSDCLPVRLNQSQQPTYYYHYSQFSNPLREIQERWNRFGEQEQKKPKQTFLRDSVPPEQLPLSTNGEPFSAEVEARMILKSSTYSFPSRYWTTVDEAEYVFGVSFKRRALCDEYAVPIVTPYDKKVYYNTSLCQKPDRFNEQVCQRYDPVNYEGVYYHPVTAVAMKRHAIQHDVLPHRLWLSVSRIKSLGFTFNRPPLVLQPIGGRSISLQNVGCTNDPYTIQLLMGNAIVDDDEESLLSLDSEVLKPATLKDF